MCKMEPDLQKSKYRWFGVVFSVKHRGHRLIYSLTNDSKMLLKLLLKGLISSYSRTHLISSYTQLFQKNCYWISVKLKKKYPVLFQGGQWWLTLCLAWHVLHFSWNLSEMGHQIYHITHPSPVGNRSLQQVITFIITISYEEEASYIIISFRWYLASGGCSVLQTSWTIWPSDSVHVIALPLYPLTL